MSNPTRNFLSLSLYGLGIVLIIAFAFMTWGLPVALAIAGIISAIVGMTVAPQR